MNIEDYRKKVFINSQYCNYYNESNGTVLAGILRNIGYKYSVVLPEEKLKTISAVYRKFTTVINSVVALEILLYVYLVVFPYFTEFMKAPFYLVVFGLSLIPLMLLYLTYVGINLLYENYLTRYVGSFKKVKFSPSIEKLDEKNYQEYKSTPRKSIYVLIAILVIFCLYAFIPLYIEGLNKSKKYDSAIRVSNSYLFFVPISPKVYANRAYAEFKLGNYEKSVKDYELADKYSLSGEFSDDILGAQTYYLDKNEMLKNFDSAISAEKYEPMKYLLKYEKATYYLKNKNYSSALSIYNSIITDYRNQKKVFFSPALAYYNRGVCKSALGDSLGAKIDKAFAEKMCPQCKFNADTTLVRMP